MQEEQESEKGKKPKPNSVNPASAVNMLKYGSIAPN